MEAQNNRISEAEVETCGKPVRLTLKDLYINCIMNIISSRNSLFCIVKFDFNFNAFNRIQNSLSSSLCGDAKSVFGVCLDCAQAPE